MRDIGAALLKHGADPEHLFGRNTLLEVMKTRKRDVSGELIKRVVHGRADVNYQDENRDNPLKRAFRRYDVGILRQLLDLNADPYFLVESSKGVTPLSWVFNAGFEDHKKIEVADILLEYRVDINARDNFGRTAIFRAIARNEIEFVEWLIQRGADLTVSSMYGVRPIDFARFGVPQGQCCETMIAKIEQAVGNTDVRDIEGVRAVWDLFADVEDEDNDNEAQEDGSDESDDEDDDEEDEDDGDEEDDEYQSESDEDDHSEDEDDEDDDDYR